MDGKLLRGDIRVGGFLLNPPNRIFAKGRPRTYTSKVGDEELIRIPSMIRYLG